MGEELRIKLLVLNITWKKTHLKGQKNKTKQFSHYITYLGKNQQNLSTTSTKSLTFMILI